MENILGFFQTNPAEAISIVIVLLIIILYFIWQLQKKGLRPLIIEFIVKAEDTFMQGQNKEKMDYVIDKIISFVPLPFSLLITRNMLKNIIQKVFDEVKKALDYNPIPVINIEEKNEEK